MLASMHTSFTGRLNERYQRSWPDAGKRMPCLLSDNLILS